jgi:hypothetical protein
MTEFENAPEKKPGFDSPQTSGGLDSNALSPFRASVERAFYGKPLLSGDVPHIFGIESELLKDGPVYQQFEQRDPAKFLAQNLGVNLKVDVGHPFVDDHGYPVRLLEVRREQAGEERWVIPDQKYLFGTMSRENLPNVEQLSTRTRLVQYVTLEDGMYRTYTTAQFDTARAGRVLEELLQNAKAALERGEGSNSSFLMRALKSLAHRQALSKIESTLRFEFDDPFLDREKSRAANYQLSKWQEGTPLAELDYQGLTVSLPAGRLSPQLDGIEFCMKTRLPFGEERFCRFGAALNASGFLVVFVAPSFPAV